MKKGNVLTSLYKYPKNSARCLCIMANQHANTCINTRDGPPENIIHVQYISK